MDESRKQFEEWFHSRYDSISMPPNDRVNLFTFSWAAWIASRAAIEIELPEAELVYSTATDTYGEDGCLMLPVETIARVLNDAGIKVKE
ncbi:TPA: hypothetical protein ACPZ0W_004245 [Enterobacter bugandensis]|uniref:hypothetical protein n=1 Tax=Enterobacter bugandensis TaxID=881260 RepID=UPI0006986079|nr:hypothetical protein [Enterobacter bugandensis]